MVEMFSASPMLSPILLTLLCDLLRVSFPFVLENMPPKSKVKVNVLNRSDKVKTLGFLEGGIALGKLGGAMGKLSQASAV
jgi:hypothetical protein